MSARVIAHDVDLGDVSCNGVVEVLKEADEFGLPLPPVGSGISAAASSVKGNKEIQCPIAPIFVFRPNWLVVTVHGADSLSLRGAERRSNLDA